MRKLAFGLVIVGALTGAAAANPLADEKTCQGNDHQRAVEACTRLIETGGMTPSREAITRYYRAYSLSETGKLREAISDLDAAIELDPTDADYFETRARSWRRLGDFDRAITDYKSALERDPRSHTSWNGIGFVYEKRHDLESALEAYRKAAEAKPDFDIAYRNIGDVYAAQGKYAQAIAAYDKAVDIDSEDGGHYRARGLAYYYAADNERAIADLRRAVEEKDGGYAMLMLHVVRARLGEDGSAELRANMMAARNNRFPFVLAELLLGKRDTDSAMRAARDDDQRCEVHFYAGAKFSMSGDVSAAADSWREAVRTCSGTIFEGVAAKVELARMTGR